MGPHFRHARSRPGRKSEQGKGQKLRLWFIPRARSAGAYALRLQRFQRGGPFAEIFAGNCTAVGLVCVTLPDGDLTKLMDRIEVDAAQEVTIDIDTRTITYREGTLTAGIACSIP
jgi:hypothetical protein